jgi:zinc protease
VQADIHVGRLAPTRNSADFFPLVSGNGILGGGTNSRMFRNIREKEGFAYDAHSEYQTERDAATIIAVTQVRNDVFEPALKAVLAELEQISSKPVSAQELTDIKNFKAGTFLLSMETQQGVMAQLTSVVAMGVPKNYLETYTSKLRSVEPDQILAAAKKYMAPGESTIIVVGDASKIGEALKKFGDVKVEKER